MYRISASCFLLLALFAGPVSAYDLSRTVDMAGRGKVEILDVSLRDQIVHLSEGRDIPLRMDTRYRVEETGPFLLNSRMGSCHWYFINYSHMERSRLHTQEDLDVSKRGEHVSSISEALFKAGEKSQKGLGGIRGRYYYLIDRPSRKHAGIVRPPPGLQTAERTGRDLAFTLADLTDYSLQLSAVSSDWAAGTPFRVKVTVTDADGETFPVVNADLTARAGEWQAPMRTELDRVFAPTGWMVCSLPNHAVPDRIEVRGSVSAMTPEGAEQSEVSAAFDRGDSDTPVPAPRTPPELPRTADGRLIESRILWVHSGDFSDRQECEQLVAKAKAARLNVLMPDIFVRGLFLAKSDVFPGAGQDEGFRALIEIAHREGLEVHAWFCCSYRQPSSLESVVPDAAQIDKAGKPRPFTIDVHDKRYRDFLVNLMVDVARNYDVDGIHHDYIRSWGTCYCEDCRREFAERFGGPIRQATNDDLIDWHNTAIWDIVQRTGEGVRAVKPDAVISAAVVRLHRGLPQGQDGAEWVKRGWVDILNTMGYDGDTLQVRLNQYDFLRRLGDAHADALCSGVCLYMHDSGRRIVRPPELIRDQIQEIRRIGAPGYTLFDSMRLNQDVVRMLSEVNREEAVPHFRVED